MAPQDPKKPISPLPSEAMPSPPDPQLDQTRMDIRVDSRTSKDKTKTSIRVEAQEIENTMDQEPAKKSFFSLNTKKRGKISQTKAAYIHKWIADPSLPVLQKVLFYFSRFFLLAAAFLLLGLLAFNAYFSYQANADWKWVLLAAFVVPFLLSFFSIPFKWYPTWFVGFPALSLILLLGAHVFFFSTVETSFLSINKRAPAFFFNDFWLIFFLAQLFLILFIYPRSIILKLFLMGLILIGLVGFGYLIYQGIPLEASWEGVGYFKLIPFVFLQPQYLVLHVLLPFLLFITFILLFFRKNKSVTSWMVFNIFALLFTATIGIYLLHLNRLPTALTLFLKPPLGVGAATAKEKGMILQTKDYEELRNNDFKERYRFIITPSPQNKEGQKEFYLAAMDSRGFPVLFLEKEDLELSDGEEFLKKWTIHPLKKEKKKGEKEIFGNYVIRFTPPSDRPRFEFTVDPQKDFLSQSDFLSWKLLDSSPSIDSYTVMVDGKPFDSLSEGLEGKRTFKIGLAQLAEGKHEIEIMVVTSEGKKSSQLITVVIKPLLSVNLLSPQSGDFFDETVEIFVQVSSLDQVQINQVGFYLDDKVIDQKTNPPFKTKFDSKNISKDKHQLKIEVSAENQSPNAQEKNIKREQVMDVYKGASPKFLIVTPTLGEYVPYQIPIEVKELGQNTLSQVQLIYKGQVIHQWDKPPYQFVWTPGELLEPGESYLVVRGKTSDGTQNSSWVNFQPGYGAFKLSPFSKQKKKPVGGVLPNFSYSKVVFLMDASLSQWDLWLGKSKWEWMQKVFSLREMTQALKGNDVSLLVMGSKYSSLQKKCRDSTWAYHSSNFQPVQALEQLRQIRPKGVLGLYHGLEEALGEKPQKIILLVDGVDACSTKIPSSLMTKIKNSHVILDVISFGKVHEKDKEVLEELTSLGSGQLIQIENEEEMKEKLSGVLSRNYELFLGDQLIYSFPADGKARQIRSGNYLLKIKTDPSFEEMEVNVPNGLTTDVELVQEKEKTKAQVNYRAMEK